MEWLGVDLAFTIFIYMTVTIDRKMQMDDNQLYAFNLRTSISYAQGHFLSTRCALHMLAAVFHVHHVHSLLKKLLRCAGGQLEYVLSVSS